MVLCLAASDQCEAPCNAVPDVDCACDVEKIRMVCAYVQEQFPDLTVREFHARSTVVRGGVRTPCAEHHAVSLSGECPYCAVLTREFLEQPVGELGGHLRRWNLGGALRVDRTVIVSGNGVTPL